MTDRPIIFSAPMVLALLAGRKTQTRRLAWRPKREKEHTGTSFDGGVTWERETPWQRVQPGDRLWVRENCWSDWEGSDGNGVRYPADGAWIKATDEERWTALDCYASSRHPDNATNTGQLVPAIHMPRWASRLTLTVTDVRVQPLKAITNDDAWAEGAPPGIGDSRFDYYKPGTQGDEMGWFAGLWEHLHGPGAWDANPEVVALTFTVHRCNIDSKEAPT